MKRNSNHSESRENHKNTLNPLGLVYSCDSDPGYSRRRCGKGFVYLGVRGTRLTGKRTLKRIETLVIPPAWEDVWICRNANGHLQVTGRDEKNRKQYIYHSNWDELRAQNKFEQLIAFAEALPAIRRRVSRDLRKKELTQSWVQALTVKIMDQTLIRVGNEYYASENQSFGLTTLREKHLKRHDDEAVFQFEGKSGKQQEIHIENKRLSDMISLCEDLPGQRLFQYLDKDGKRSPLQSEDVNQYLQEITGEDITAKVFRTWGATVEAAVQLARLSPPGSATAARKKKVKAVKQTAARLGNTPAVTRSSYIAPVIFKLFDSGLLEKMMARSRSTRRGLTAAEQCVQDILLENHENK